jgi:hypothetical protein
MTGDGDPVGVAAVFGDMVAGPFHRQGAVIDERGEAHRRDHAIIGDDGDEALPRIAGAGKGITTARPRDPAAAIEEDHHRKLVVRSWRGPHVELEPGHGGEGDPLGNAPRAMVARDEPVDPAEQVRRRAGGERKQGGGEGGFLHGRVTRALRTRMPGPVVPSHQRSTPLIWPQVRAAV